MLAPQRLFQLLEQEKVEAVLVGGVAMILQGVPHDTNDVDLCYARDPANLERLVWALTPLHPRLRVEGLTDDEARALSFQLDVRALRNAQTLTLMTDAGGVDLLASISGVGGYDQMRDHILVLDIYGIQVPVLDLATIIDNKRAAGRPKDLAALPRLEALLRLREERAQTGPGASSPLASQEPHVLEE